jgi:hypothetical protein
VESELSPKQQLAWTQQANIESMENGEKQNWNDSSYKFLSEHSERSRESNLI